MKKIAILFPGIGYTCRRPLLHYAGDLADGHNYEVVRLDYGSEIVNSRERTRNALDKAIDLAVELAVLRLSRIDFSYYDDIVFISKSIGTTVACKCAEKIKIKARQFMMTPVAQTIPYLDNVEGLFFSGTKDDYVETKIVINACDKHPEMIGHIFEGCNHSLEKKGDTFNNIDNLETVMHSLDSFLK